MSSLKEKFKMSLTDLWNNHKVFLIIFGVLILIVKFRGILIDILVSDGKRVMNDAKKKDAELAGQENKLKSDADELVKKAQEAPSKEKPVDVDWNKK